ncbi:hypothetical protein RFI_31507 [Reticulomyxa filosa]|uniref:TRAF-type domain-containing protein n=1 Tax=Reticulomyxa filosa TaxID=46433 RepID=X6LYV8_RETFI|nr:hypothetical protein RFI_31507 [Reticulomyxa filosa]|eukprot:ETO05890.1 hypothetical protein RFI_31507 [Reticulomyxa filosa]
MNSIYFVDKKWKDKELSVKTRVTPVPFGNKCFDRNWVLKLNNQDCISNFICLVCKQVANNSVEISCSQHEGAEKALIVGENCLKQFLSNNNNTCPVRPHNGCQYYKAQSVRMHIDGLNVICPNQFNQDLAHEGRQTGYIITMFGFKGNKRYA